MKLKLLLLFLVVMGFGALVNAQTVKRPYNNLIITEQFQGNSPYNYFEFTNKGTETIDLSEFEFGWISAWTNPGADWATGAGWDAGAGNFFMFPKAMLAPGQTWLIATAYTYNPIAWLKDPEHFSERITKPEMFKLANQMFHFPETEPLQPTDSVTPNYNALNGWGGRETYYLRHHYIDPVTGLKDSIVIDQVGGLFDDSSPEGTNTKGAHDVAGVVGATFTHVLIRKNTVTTGNLDFNSGRGLDLADSEWIPVKLLGWNQSWRAVFWTTGNQVNAVIDANTLVSKTGKVLVDLNASTITVPWGVRNDDSIMYQFVRKPGLAWAYDYHTAAAGTADYAQAVADSAFNTIRTGDILTLYACGDQATIQKFNLIALPPTKDDNIVIPKNGYDYKHHMYGQYIQPYNGYRVTDGVKGMDSINHISFATRVDTLMKYLEKPDNASWKIVFKSGVVKPDLQNGDILRVTSESGKVKDYFLKLTKYVPSSTTLLSSITWPDMPSFFKGDIAKSYGWKGDTIPSFGPSVKSYVVTVPLGYDGIPGLAFTKSALGSKVVVNRAKTLTGSVADATVTFTVTAENDTSKAVYTVRFDKELDMTNVQPWMGEPFFSQIVFRDTWANGFVEIANPGTAPLDLSGYMVTAAYGTEANTWTWNNGVADIGNKYYKYIPGKKWDDDANWQVQPRMVIPDLATNSLVYPQDVFVMAHLVDNWVTVANHPYSKYVDINFATVASNPKLGNPWGINLNGADIPNVWCNNDIYLYKIMNDSVKNGLKPAIDRNDFKILDQFGGVNTNNWLIAGFDASSQEVGFTRKSNIYKPNPVPNASWGTNTTDSEWFKSRPADFNSLNLGWPWGDIAICSGIGSVTLDAITMYRSTVASTVYKVSPGYSKNESIKGLTTGTNVSAFYANIIKANPLQTLKVKSASTGLIIPDANAISKGDSLIVLSADSTNTSKYVLDVTANGLSADAMLTSSMYTITTTGATGTVGGFPQGTLLKTVVAGVNVPAGATMTMTDANDAYMTLVKLNYDSLYVNTIATDAVYFKVVAENGTTNITYQLTPTSNPSDAYVTSDIYSVDQFASLIQFVPNGTSVAELFSNLTPAPGATMTVYDKGGFVRDMGTIYRDDKLMVTSSDGKVKKAYYFSMLNYEVNTYLAYVVSDSYTIDQVNFIITVTGAKDQTSVGEFTNLLYPSFGATLKVMDMNGAVITGNLPEGTKLLVTAADGMTTATYTVNFATGVAPAPKSLVQMYPNPTSDRVNIIGLAKGNRVQVINSVGVTLRDVLVENSTEYVSLSAQPAGIYIIVISNGKQNLSIQKIIKK